VTVMLDRLVTSARGESTGVDLSKNNYDLRLEIFQLVNFRRK